MNHSILLMKCLKSEGNKISVFSEKNNAKLNYELLNSLKSYFLTIAWADSGFFCIFMISVKRQFQRYPYDWGILISVHYYDFRIEWRTPEFVKIRFSYDRMDGLTKYWYHIDQLNNTILTMPISMDIISRQYLLSLMF